MAGPVTDLQKQIFLQLKPYCIEVSQIALGAQASLAAFPGLAQRLTPALEAILRTLKQVPDLENALTPALGDYIFFPLSYIFRKHQNVPDRSLELSLEILHVLISTCWRLNISRELAKQLVILVTFIIGGSLSRAPAVAHRASEECRIAGCKCLVGLLQTLSVLEAWESFFADAHNVPVFGHMVSTILETLVTYNESLELGLVCIDALQILYGALLKDLDIIASFYPGTVSQLSKILAPSTRARTSYKLIVRSIDLLREVITKLLADDIVSNLPSEDQNFRPLDDTPKICRTASWFKATSIQTKMALQGVLVSARSHSKLEVRMAIFKLCRELLQKCFKFIAVSEGVELLVESLVILCGEDDLDLARLSEDCLREAVVSAPIIADTLQLSLRGWITSMPRIMQSNDEDKKPRLVARISTSFSMLNVLGLESQVLQEMIAQYLQDSLRATDAFSGAEIDMIEAHEVELATTLSLKKGITSSTSATTSYPDLVLGRRSQAETIKSLKSLFRKMGSATPASSLQLCRRYIWEAEVGSPIPLWLALNLLRAASTRDSAGVQFLVDSDLITPVLHEQLLDELFPVTLSMLNNATTATVETSEDDKNGSLSCCLALEAIAFIAEWQGIDFRHQMMDVLYPIVHLLGSDSSVIRQHAIITLNKVASFCLYSSPQDLILDNVDYLINTLALKLNTFNISPQAPLVLRMMVRLTGKKLVPFLDDLVESIFGSLANYHGYEGLCKGLFEVLNDIVEVESGIGEEVKAIDELDRPIKKTDYKLTNEGLLTILRENKDRRKRARLDEKRETKKDQMKTEFPSEPWGQRNADEPDPQFPEGGLYEDELVNSKTAMALQKEAASEIPKAYKMIQSISRLTQHYLSHPSSSLRLRLLQLVSTSSRYLSNIEDEFLPLVNDLWPVLFPRLFDDEAHVVIGAAKTIADLATTAGNFLASRMEEGWRDSTINGKGIRGLLLELRGRLNKERKGNAGRGVYSPDYQMWDALLRMMAAVVRYCGINDEIINELLGIVGGTLLENTVLKEALEYANEDAVWLELEGRRSPADLCGVQIEKPEVEGFVFSGLVF